MKMKRMITMYAHKRGNISNTLRSEKFEFKLDAFNSKFVKKDNKIKYKGILCLIKRIDSVEVSDGYVIIKGSLTPLEVGLNQ